MSPEHSKDSSLFWLSVYIRLHLLGRTMFNSYLLLVDLVLDEVIPHLICVVLFELLAFPLVLSRIALMLS
jgi:hypothetical protein